MEPRLTVFAARDADVAVVLRRGPSAWSRLSLWDTATDEVTHGGWLRARVDPRRADLSPDGRLFGAFVQRHGLGADEDGQRDWRRDSWVAISRPPWWHALALWWNGSAWDLGLCFPDAASCSVGAHPPDQGEVPRWFRSDAPLPHARPGREWTTTTVPHNRRQRDGWEQVEPGWWERPLSGGGTAVHRERPTGTSHTDTEAALRLGEELTVLPTTASLDVDRRGRALVAVDGRLEAHTAHGSSGWSVTPVATLTTQEPTPAPAPEWASRWPDGPSATGRT